MPLRDPLQVSTWRYDAELVARRSADWGGFRMEIATWSASRPCQFDVRSPDDRLSFALDGALPRVEARFEDRRTARYALRPGWTGFFPAQQRVHGRTQGVGAWRQVYLFFEPRVLERVSGGEAGPSRLELGPALDLSSGVIQRAMLALVREVEHPGPLGRVYVESLALAALTELARLRPDRGAAVRPQAEAGAQSLRRVLDYVEAHLGEDVSVFTLAAEAGVSPRQLARQFRQATGAAPHQYVLRRRIERARALLARRYLSLAEIAVAVGFSSQAHLTSAFGRAYGVTPGAYRRRQTGPPARTTCPPSGASPAPGECPLLERRPPRRSAS